MVEQVFRTAKSLLATQPIYHQSDAAIRGHAFCIFLALILCKDFEERLAAANLKPEWAELLRDLNRLQEVEVAHDGKRFILRHRRPVSPESCSQLPASSCRQHPRGRARRGAGLAKTGIDASNAVLRNRRASVSH